MSVNIRRDDPPEVRLPIKSITLSTNGGSGESLTFERKRAAGPGTCIGVSRDKTDRQNMTPPSRIA